MTTLIRREMPTLFAIGFALCASPALAGTGPECVNNLDRNGAVNPSSLECGNGSTAFGTLLSTAVGANAKADGPGGHGATAVGYAASAQSSQAVAIGINSRAEGVGSFAGGNRAAAIGHYSAAVGERASAAGNNSNALGHLASAAGSYSVALGGAELVIEQSAPGSNIFVGRTLFTQADGLRAVAVGTAADASGANAAALGSRATASATNAIAIGRLSEAAGNGAIAVGADAQASGARSAAIGTAASASHDGAIAIGAGAATTASNQVALGGAGSSVRIGDIDASTAAQAGPVEGVTVDSSGTLGRLAVVSAAQFGALQQSTAQALAANNTRIDQLSGRVDTLFDLAETNRRDIREANEGVAMALAMESPSIPAGAKFALSGGVGHYKGRTSMAMAVSAAVSEMASLSAGVGVGANSGEVGVRGGFQVAW